MFKIIISASALSITVDTPAFSANAEDPVNWDGLYVGDNGAPTRRRLPDSRLAGA
ncbi:hypothetical protein FHW92_001715 [Novosphingobium sp. SG707]|nr:hypothetical protein [Novosphingobium sp. SG707]